MRNWIFNFLTKLLIKRFFRAVYRIALERNIKFAIFLFWAIPSIILIFVLALCIIEYTEKEKLQVQATSLAKQVQALLEKAETDVVYLADLYQPRGASSDNPYHEFLRRYQYPLSAQDRSPISSHPLYAKLVVVDEEGQETIYTPEDPEPIIQSGNASSGLDVSKGDRRKTYINETKNYVDREGSFVSHLERLYVPMEDSFTHTQPDNFQGWIVYGHPLPKNGTGKSGGVLLLYLNAIHIIEIVRNVDLVRGWGYSWEYGKGDYAAIIDNEGWVIAHPRISHIRGSDSGGNNVRYLESDADVGKFPIKVQILEGRGKMEKLIRTLYDEMYIDMLKKRSGCVKYRNLSKQFRLLAYSPIYYNKGGSYDDGIFGAIWLGKRISSNGYILTYPTTWFNDLEAWPYWIILGLILFAWTYLAVTLASFTGLTEFLNHLSSTNRRFIFRDPEVLKPRRRTVVVLHADIRNFLELSLALETTVSWNFRQLGAFIHKFHEHMASVICKCDGIICNRFNDQFVAVFGAFNKSDEDYLPEATRNAVSCATEMHTKFHEISVSLFTEQGMLKHAASDGKETLPLERLQLGIGITTGDAVVGSLSGYLWEEFRFAAVGSPISLALMEQMISSGGETIIDENTKKLLPKDFIDKKNIKLSPKGITLYPVDIKATVYLVQFLKR